MAHRLVYPSIEGSSQSKSKHRTTTSGANGTLIPMAVAIVAISRINSRTNLLRFRTSEALQFRLEDTKAIPQIL